MGKCICDIGLEGGPLLDNDTFCSQVVLLTTIALNCIKCGYINFIPSCQDCIYGSCSDDQKVLTNKA
jgi:hypothetical protein